ncbi:MAG: polar amino acid transport system substrate-binding protein [Oceanicoccus sp.]|jgi:polar amino acid transport system substrate-binding protein
MGKLGVAILLLLSLSAQGNPSIQITQALDGMFSDIQQLSNQTYDDYQNLIAIHISPHIDILNMSQLILGRHWKRASIDQKQRFLGCFKRQFRSTQSKALSEWQPRSWQLVRTEFNENKTKAAVIMLLKQSNESREFTLRLHLIENKWLIYDAAYLGLSLLKNFKDDYAVKINSQGLNKTLAQVCQEYPEIIKHLTIAGTQWPPFIARSLPGQGLSVEMVSAILTRAGYKVDMVFAPWKRVQQGMKQGEYDISVAAWKSEKREQYLAFSDPYFYNQLVGLKHKESSFKMDTLNEALSQSLSLGLIDDYAYSPQIQQYPNRRYLKHYTALFRAIATKDLDFSLLDRSVAQYYLERKPALQNSLQVTTTSLEVKPLHISMVKQHPAVKEVITNFNRYLKMYLKSNDYRTLLTRYGIENQQSR